MTGADYDAEVVHEEATNQRYLALCRDKSLRAAALTAAITSSSKWTRAGGNFNSQAAAHPLVGRVLLDHLSDYIDAASFYVGPTRLEADGLVVVSWAAPIAKCFFQDDDDAYDLSPYVILRRSLQSKGHTIVSLTDEWVPGIVFSGVPFVEASESLIPPPPQTLSSVPPPPAPSAPVVHKTVAPVDPPPVAPPRAPEPMALPPSPRPSRAPRIPAPRRAGIATPRRLRAEQAVLDSLAAPRTASLRAILETLQPDQYELVTRPVDEPLLVQGHAGTGKTIIAAHRAAYLVNAERGAGSVGRVLLVGPSTEYAQHVQAVLAALDPRRAVTTTGLTPWMQQLIGPMKLTDDSPPSMEDVAGDIADLCQRAVAHLVATDPDLAAGRRTPATMGRVFEAVRTNRVGRLRLTRSVALDAWARALPPYAHASQMRRYLPLLAACAMAIRPPSKLQSYAHVVVDEAQDLSQLEWRLLAAVNAGNGWTMVGDTNQRSVDSAVPSWRSIVSFLGLTDADGKAEPVELVRGYRSTKAIMRFAGRLLPRGRRTIDSLQVDGPEPEIRKTTPKALTSSAVTAATALQLRYPRGTVAIIAIAPGRFKMALKEAGWQPMVGGQHAWAKDSHELLLYSPEEARGLEFDGVVVAEPADFPLAKKADGPLYTSLTRPNRELCIVHARPLPAALRSARQPNLGPQPALPERGPTKPPRRPDRVAVKLSSATPSDPAQARRSLLADLLRLDTGGRGTIMRGGPLDGQAHPHSPSGRYAFALGQDGSLDGEPFAFFADYIQDGMTAMFVGCRPPQAAWPFPR